MRPQFRRILWPVWPALAVLTYAVPTPAQDAVRLVERFDPGHSYKADVRVSLDGRLAVPLEKGQPPKLVTITGQSAITYDERILPPDEPDTRKAVRAYRTVEFRRAVGDK